jgi:DNA-binding protein HU-beta
MGVPVCSTFFSSDGRDFCYIKGKKALECYTCSSLKKRLEEKGGEEGMTKKDLVDKMAAGAGIKKTQAEKAIEAFATAVRDALKKGDRVTVTGFGTFSVVERKARTGRNPRTGKEIKIAAKKVPKFSPASAMKDSMA